MSIGRFASCTLPSASERRIPSTVESSTARSTVASRSRSQVLRGEVRLLANERRGHLVERACELPTSPGPSPAPSRRGRRGDVARRGGDPAERRTARGGGRRARRRRALGRRRRRTGVQAGLSAARRGAVVGEIAPAATNGRSAARSPRRASRRRPRPARGRVERAASEPDDRPADRTLATRGRAPSTTRPVRLRAARLGRQPPRPTYGCRKLWPVITYPRARLQVEDELLDAQRRRDRLVGGCSSRVDGGSSAASCGEDELSQEDARRHAPPIRIRPVSPRRIQILSGHGGRHRIALRKELSGSVLFDGVSFKVERRDRLALAGPNGAGKTTLLRALAGEVSLEGGELALAKGARSRCTTSARRQSSQPLRDYVLAGTADLAAVEAELRALEEAMASGDARRRDAAPLLRGAGAARARGRLRLARPGGVVRARARLHRRRPRTGRSRPSRAAS